MTGFAWLDFEYITIMCLLRLTTFLLRKSGRHILHETYAKLVESASRVQTLRL